MDPTAYEVVHELEQSHWFFVARRRILSRLLDDLLVGIDQPKILDVGCGTGATMGFLERYQEEVEDYTKAIELNPTDPAAYYNRGLTYANANLYEKALQDFQRAADLAPGDPKARYGLATTHSLLGDAPAAIDSLAQALELAPDYGYTAATDEAFDNVRDNPAFMALVGG